MRLAEVAPLSFRKAQDLLVAVQHYLQRNGFFATEKSRLAKVEGGVSELLAALKTDGFKLGRAPVTDGDLLFDFL
jgi:hypothetical protein